LPLGDQADVPLEDFRLHPDFGVVHDGERNIARSQIISRADSLPDDEAARRRVDRDAILRFAALLELRDLGVRDPHKRRRARVACVTLWARVSASWSCCGLEETSASALAARRNSSCVRDEVGAVDLVERISFADAAALEVHEQLVDSPCDARAQHRDVAIVVLDEPTVRSSRTSGR
jgi:hypothetical protein